MRLITLFSLICATCAVTVPSSTTFSISATAPVNSSKPVLKAFVSFSIELAFFPDFAGNSSQPNVFSDNLLNNIGNLTGTKPIIRVGGNTQDYALYNSSLQVATNGTYTAASSDYPTILFIGPSFFDSYSTWPGTTYSHGFSLAKNGSIGLSSLLATVPLACKALEGGRLSHWELGNEPDLYKTSSQGIVRPANWTEQSYVDEWLHKTRLMRSVMAENCPDLPFAFIAPSFAGTSNSLDPIITWRDGLDQDHDISLISSHNYIGGATQPGVTLQGTLMNHSSTVASIAKQVNESDLLTSYGLPFTLGETNSLYNEGASGLSNAFGAALWGVDFNLYCASQNIQRTHMHQGTDYRYALWQPIETNKTTIGTKPPYYGNIAVAATLGDITKANVSVVNIPLSSEFEAAYAIYENGIFAKAAIVNLVEYNYTGSAATVRPSAEYTISVPDGRNGSVQVQRLMANGSDALSGITFDGYSYNYELNNGKPVLLPNTTRGETVQVQNGQAMVEVPYSSFALLNFKN